VIFNFVSGSIEDRQPVAKNPIQRIMSVSDIKYLSSKKVPLFFTAVWLLYLLLSPIYIFSKGLPQPADYIIFVLGFPALIITWMKHRGGVSKVFLFGALFAGLTVFINLIHFGFWHDDRLLRQSSYYIFNFCAFLFTLIVFKQNPKVINRLTYFAVAATIIFQAIYAPLFGEVELLRNLGTFNNPNQLAYWALLSMSMIIILKRDQKFNFFDFILFCLCIYIESLALSKAGIIITVLMTASLFFLPNMPKNGRIMIVIGLIGFFLFQLFDPSYLVNKLEHINRISRVVARIDNIGQEQDDSVEGRGYGRLLRYPHYMIFGAGEGAFFRFGIGAQEIHSGLATLLFSYGVTGFFFFGLFIWAVSKDLPKQYYLILALIFMFGLPHQNIRFTYFWIFLAIMHTHHLYFNQKKQLENEED